jgi:multidrug efflux pump subunit AcrA (membrane-fusion protein)
VSWRKVLWIVLGILVVVAAAGGAYYYFRVRPAQAAQAAAAQTPTVATGAVTRGDLVISASGSGTLVPAREMEVGFQSGGTLKEVLVKLGGVVEAGQTLAILDDTDLRNAVTQAEISLRLAQISLDTLSESADASELAAAQASVASAKASLAKLTAAPDSQSLLAARETRKSAP